MKINDTHPELVKQWVKSTGSNDALEGDLLKYSYGSKKKFTWRCTEYPEHMWDTSISVRVNGYGCPYCTNRSVFVGFNDLGTKIPELLKKWNYEKNYPLTPQDVMYASTKKYWWTCSYGHDTYGNIQSRKNRRTGEYSACAMCSGHMAIPGETDLLTVNPKMSAECISDVDLSTITSQSSIVLEWKCEKGHIVKESPCVRFRINKLGKTTYCRVCKAIYNDKKEKEKRTKRVELEKRKEDSLLINKNKNLFGELLDGEKNKNVSYNSARRVEWLCDKGHIWDAVVYQRYRGSNCPVCSSQTYSSNGEKEIANFIKSIYSGEVKENTRSLIHPHELDIYIPEKNVAIEYNGVYWHSDAAGKEKTYHYDKWKKCQEKEIQLIQVWEDDWRDKQDIVKSMIKHKMGLSTDKKVFARKTDVVNLSYQDAYEFCNKRHIQDGIQGSAYLSLKDKETGETVAVSVWRKRGKDFLLERYCTSVPVVGGMGKLLQAGIKYAKGIGMESIITFSDHEVSDGGLYEKLGFAKDKEIKPDYKYVVKNTRKHKFGYRKSRFRTDPELKYQEGLSESQLAKLNNIPKVYDSGKTRWVMEL